MSATVLGILSGVLFLVFRIGIDAWLKMEGHSDVMQSLQVIGIKMITDFERTALSSVTISSDQQALSCLSAVGDTGVKTNPSGALDWQYYVLYHQEGDQVLRKRIGLSQGSPPGPLSDLEANRSEGDPVGSFVTEMSFEQNDRLLIVSLVAVQTKQRSDRTETAEREIVVRIRN